MVATNDMKEIVACGKNPEYFLKKYVKIQHARRGRIPFDTYSFQDDCLEDFKKHRFNIILKSRQLGLSTISAGYCLWLALFYKDKNILVIATKLSTAMEFIKKVKTMLESVPKNLLLTQYTTTKQSVSFTNGSVITAIPTSEDAGRGQALSLLVVDECVAHETTITVRNKVTGEVKNIPIGDFYDLLHDQREAESDADVSTVQNVSDGQALCASEAPEEQAHKVR